MQRASGLRERKKSATRDAIVRAALELFETKGFDATTVDEIAEAADVSSRTFFRYFETKLDVLLEDKVEPHPTIEALVSARPKDEDPITAFQHGTREELGAIMAGDEFAVRRFRIMLTTPALRAVALEHFHEHQEELVGVFAKRLGAADDELRPRVMAAAAAGAAWTAVERWAEHGSGPDDLLPMIDEAFELLRRGFA